MIWTLVVFFISFSCCARSRVRADRGAGRERRTIVRENLEAAERSRDEAQELLEEYKQQLAQARREAARSSSAPGHRRDELDADARGGAGAARARDRRGQAAIEAETRQAIEQIKNRSPTSRCWRPRRSCGRALDEKEQRRLSSKRRWPRSTSPLAGEEVGRWRCAPGGRRLQCGAGRGRAGGRPLDEVQRDLADLGAPGRTRPSWRRCSLNPAFPTPRQEAILSAEPVRAPTSSSRNAAARARRQRPARRAVRRSPRTSASADQRARRELEVELTPPCRSTTPRRSDLRAARRGDRQDGHAAAPRRRRDPRGRRPAHARPARRRFGARPARRAAPVAT